MNVNFERYHCQMALPGFGESTQKLLQKARVLIVGAGGLGCPAAQYLAAAGIGTIGIADDDMIALNNLHRQILYTPDDAGLPKVAVMTEKLQKQNPGIKILPYHQRVTSANVKALIATFDLVIEGTDNFETKYLLNDACVLSGRPLVYGAIYRYEGQVSIWNVLQPDGMYSVNYRDVFPDAENAQVPDCADGGVMPTLAGIVGCMQANEAIKYISHSEDLLSGKLWMINISDGKTRIINLKKRSSVKITGLSETIQTITLDEIQNKMNREDLELVDVRTRAEHDFFNIGGKNIPMDALKGRLDTLCLSKPVVCYCTSGERSSAAARLIKNTYPGTVVYSLKDGIGKLQKQEIV